MNATPLSAPFDLRVPPRISSVRIAQDAAPLTKPRFRIRKRYVAALLLLVFPLLVVIGVTGYFRLGSETETLGASVRKSLAGEWDKRFALNVGGLTFGLVRVGSSLFSLPPEARAGLSAIRGAQVAIYDRQCSPQAVVPATVFAAADRAMAGRGWQRLVGVAQDRQIVAVYIPRQGIGRGQVKCCVAVLQDRQLVVVSARADIEPLVALAERKLDLAAYRKLGLP